LPVSVETSNHKVWYRINHIPTKPKCEKPLCRSDNFHQVVNVGYIGYGGGAPKYVDKLALVIRFRAGDGIKDERWLTRQEAAKLIRVAWRQHGYLKGAKFYTSRHIARFILCGLYTGSRAGDICGAALLPTIGRGYVDLDRGIFKRKPDSKKETSKRQPTTPLPPRLLVHMRRWHRLGISNHSVIEHHGRQIGRVRQGFETAVRVAGLATDDKRRKVTPHTLRHTAISWYLASGTDIELVAQFTGVSVPTIRKVYRHVLPGIFNPVLEAAHKFGR
jgi:integrase